MKFWRRLISSSIIALSLASCGGEKSPQQIDQQIRDSVVLITYPGEEGHGTGFFIPGPKGVCTVLTVNHVLPPDRGYRLQSHDDKIWEDVEIKRLKSLDLAVAIFRPEQKNCPYKSIPLGDSKQVLRGDTIHVLGYPDAAHQLDQHFVSGQVTAFTAPKPEGYAIAYNATTERGMSGAPVVDTRGKVIAVHGRTQVERQGGTPDSPDSVEVNTFKWSIPINTYIINKPAIIVETVDKPTLLLSISKGVEMVFRVLGGINLCLGFLLALIVYLFPPKSKSAWRECLAVMILNITLGISWIGYFIFPSWAQEIAIGSTGSINLYMAYDLAKSMYRDRRKSKIKLLMYLGWMIWCILGGIYGIAYFIVRFDIPEKVFNSIPDRSFRTINLCLGSINDLGFSPDGKTLVSVSSDDTIKLWDLQTGQQLRTVYKTCRKS